MGETGSSSSAEDVVSKQSDFQKTQSNTSKEQIPESIQKALVFKKQLEEISRKEELKSRLRYAKYRASLKGNNYLPSDSIYYPLTASHCVPIKFPAPIPTLPKKNTHRNPHNQCAPFPNRKAWQDFKKLDEAAKIPTLEGVPFPIDDEIKNPLKKDSDVACSIRDFAVHAFNDSYQMYVNNNNKKNIQKAKIRDCYYVKFGELYLFCITIKATEQKKNPGLYDIRVSCRIANGAITLHLFALQSSSGTREAAISCQEATYETVADGWAEPEFCYDTCGMLRRRWCSGYDYSNPYGFYRRLWSDCPL